MIKYRRSDGRVFTRSKPSKLMERSPRFTRVEASADVQASDTIDGEGQTDTEGKSSDADTGEQSSGRPKGRGGRSGAQTGAEGASGGDS